MYLEITKETTNPKMHHVICKYTAQPIFRTYSSYTVVHELNSLPLMFPHELWEERFNDNTSWIQTLDFTVLDDFLHAGHCKRMHPCISWSWILSLRNRWIWFQWRFRMFPQNLVKMAHACQIFHRRQSIPTPRNECSTKGSKDSSSSGKFEISVVGIGSSSTIRRFMTIWFEALIRAPSRCGERNTFLFYVYAVNMRVSEMQAILTFFPPLAVMFEKPPPTSDRVVSSKGGLNFPLSMRSTSLRFSSPGIKDARNGRLSTSFPFNKTLGNPSNWTVLGRSKHSSSTSMVSFCSILSAGCRKKNKNEEKVIIVLQKHCLTHPDGSDWKLQVQVNSVTGGEASDMGNSMQVLLRKSKTSLQSAQTIIRHKSAQCQWSSWCKSELEF